MKGAKHKLDVTGHDLYFGQRNEYIYGVRPWPWDVPGLVRFAVNQLPAGDLDSWELVHQVDVATMEGNIGFDTHLCRAQDWIAFHVEREVNTDSPHADIYLKKPGVPAERIGGDPGVNDRFPVLSPDCSMVAWAAIDKEGGASRVAWKSLGPAAVSGTIDATSKTWLLEHPGSVGMGFSGDGKRLAFHGGTNGQDTFVGVYDFDRGELTKIAETDNDWYYRDLIWLK